MDWEKFKTCRHIWTDYYDCGPCWGALGCVWYERHCKKCGAYVSRCPCGTEDGVAAVPRRKAERREKKTIPCTTEAGNDVV